MIEIAVALVAAIGAVSVALLQKSRKENSTDHRAVMSTLRDVGRRVTNIDEKVGRLDDKIEKIDTKVERYAANAETDRRTAK